MKWSFKNTLAVRVFGNNEEKARNGLLVLIGGRFAVIKCLFWFSVVVLWFVFLLFYFGGGVV